MWISGDDIVSIEFFLLDEQTKEKHVDDGTKAAAAQEQPGSEESQKPEESVPPQPPYRTKRGWGDPPEELGDTSTQPSSSAEGAATVPEQASGATA